MTTSHLTWLANNASLVIDETTSHLTKVASCQVIGYGYRSPAEELLMEPLAIRLSEQTTLAKSLVMAGHPKDGNQVAGYS